MHSFGKYLVSTQYIPGPALGTENTNINISKTHFLISVILQYEEGDKPMHILNIP